MSNSKLIKSLELSRSLMRSQIEALREEAEDLCTNYWIEWKERNHLEINLPRPSNTLKREYLGSYAPKLELIGNAKKSLSPGISSVRLKPGHPAICRNGFLR